MADNLFQAMSALMNEGGRPRQLVVNKRPSMEDLRTKDWRVVTNCNSLLYFKAEDVNAIAIAVRQAVSDPVRALQALRNAPKMTPELAETRVPAGVHAGGGAT